MFIVYVALNLKRYTSIHRYQFRYYTNSQNSRLVISKLTTLVQITEEKIPQINKISHCNSFIQRTIILLTMQWVNNLLYYFRFSS